MALTSSVIIPTYNRPRELTVCLRSLLRQTRLPTEVIVVDDGDLPAVPFQRDFEAAGVACRYISKDAPGLTESRNAGVAMAVGDIVFFLDDDVELFPDYLEKILDVYAVDHGGVVAGVGGRVANDKPMNLVRILRWLVDLLFLNCGVRAGRILPSGFCTDYGRTPFMPRTARPVQFLSGGASSFRKRIFDDMSFTRGYRSVALGEDKDFTGRLSRVHRLVFVPDARLNHYEAASMRPPKRDWGRKFLLGRYLFFRAVVQRRWWHWICFYYAATGYLLVRSAIALISFDRGEYARVAGILEGLRMAVTGKVTLPDPDL